MKKLLGVNISENIKDIASSENLTLVYFVESVHRLHIKYLPQYLKFSLRKKIVYKWLKKTKGYLSVLLLLLLKKNHP